MQVTATVPCSDVSLVRTSLIVKHATVPDICGLVVCWALQLQARPRHRLANLESVRSKRLNFRTSHQKSPEHRAVT